MFSAKEWSQGLLATPNEIPVKHFQDNIEAKSSIGSAKNAHSKHSLAFSLAAEKKE